MLVELKEGLTLPIENYKIEIFIGPENGAM
jgi:hypothetical protein